MKRQSVTPVLAACALYYRPVPEPSTLALVGFATDGLGLLIWKRRRRTAACVKGQPTK